MDRVNTDYYRCYIRKRMFNNGYYGTKNKALPVGKIFSVIDVKKIEGHVYVRLSNNHWYPVKNLQCTTTTSALSSSCLGVHAALNEGHTSIIVVCVNYNQVQAYLHELRVFFTSNRVPFDIKKANSTINVGYARVRLIVPDGSHKLWGLTCQVVVDPTRILTGAQYAYLLRHKNQ